MRANRFRDYEFFKVVSGHGTQEYKRIPRKLPQECMVFGCNEGKPDVLLRENRLSMPHAPPNDNCIAARSHLVGLWVAQPTVQITRGTIGGQ